MRRLGASVLFCAKLSCQTHQASASSKSVPQRHCGATEATPGSAVRVIYWMACGPMFGCHWRSTAALRVLPKEVSEDLCGRTLLLRCVAPITVEGRTSPRVPFLFGRSTLVR